MLQSKSDIFSQTLTLLSRQASLSFQSTPLSDRIQSLLHSQFLKTLQSPLSAPLPSDKLSYLIQQQQSQYSYSQYSVDKDKFVPSQDLLNKFQQLYPFSVNEVEKVIAEKMIPIFDEPKKMYSSGAGDSGFVGGSEGRSDGGFWKRPWVLEKKDVGFEESMRSGVKMGVENQMRATVSPSKNFSVRYNEEIQRSNGLFIEKQQIGEIPQEKQGKVAQKLQTKEKTQNQQKKGLDYWKKKRQQMSQSIK